MFSSYFFNGTTAEVALVIAGIHGSELSGIEVANWMCVKLNNMFQKGKLPKYTTIIIPEIYPKQARMAREYRRRNSFTKDHSATGRLVTMGKIAVEPNRQFPRPGKPASSYSYLAFVPGPVSIKVTEGGQPVLRETEELLCLIELVKPMRIASIHAHGKVRYPTKGTDAPGIFVDPQYTLTSDCLEEASYTVKDPNTGREKKITGRYITNRCKFDLTRDPAFPQIKKPGVKKETTSAIDSDEKKGRSNCIKYCYCDRKKTARSCAWKSFRG